MKPTCAAPVLDAEKRASICGKPATAKRTIEGVELPLCSACALRFDTRDTKSTLFARVMLEPTIAVRLEAMAVSLAPSGRAPRREEALRLAIALGLEAWEAGWKKDEQDEQEGGRR